MCSIFFFSWKIRLRFLCIFSGKVPNRVFREGKFYLLWWKGGELDEWHIKDLTTLLDSFSQGFNHLWASCGDMMSLTISWRGLVQRHNLDWWARRICKHMQVYWSRLGWVFSLLWSNFPFSITSRKERLDWLFASTILKKIHVSSKIQTNFKIGLVLGTKPLLK